MAAINMDGTFGVSWFGHTIGHEPRRSFSIRTLKSLRATFPNAPERFD
jgi:hypothetical protein